MYIPEHFREDDFEHLTQLIGERPLGTLVTMTPDGLVANSVPFLHDPAPAPWGTLRCHVARSNPVWRNFSGETDALVVFHGPDAYVSPSWYPGKKVHGKVVPTWNYVTVHVYGSLVIHDEPDWKRDFLDQLTTRFEASRVEPWKLDDAPADYLRAAFDAIVGIEIPVRKMLGKWKVSQNRSVDDRAGIVGGLRAEDDADAAATADLVEKAMPIKQ